MGKIERDAWALLLNSQHALAYGLENKRTNQLNVLRLSIEYNN
ncbi:Uncharacterised protein [Moellerella wisconsensis]|nr:Uncharacterised protein [Moellerella wisconsensis]